jgi:hypothetical protein
MVLCVAMQFSLLGGYHRFEGMYCQYLQGISALHCTLKMEAILSCETSATIHNATWCHNPKYHRASALT